MIFFYNQANFIHVGIAANHIDISPKKKNPNTLPGIVATLTSSHRFIAISYSILTHLFIQALLVCMETKYTPLLDVKKIKNTS